MVSAASSLILLARVPPTSLVSPVAAYLAILVRWLRFTEAGSGYGAPDELTGRPFWLIGMGSLAVAAARVPTRWRSRMGLRPDPGGRSVVFVV